MNIKKLLLIRNAQVVDPVTDTDAERDILIQGNEIIRVEKKIDLPGEDTCCEVIEAEGLVAAPGLMDAHVHFRDPGFTWKEDIFTGAAAAAKGGFTTVVCMANTKPVVDCPEILQENQEKSTRAGIHVLHVSSVTKGLKGKELTDMEAMAAAGAAGFSDDGIPIMDEALLYEAMNRAAALDLPLSLHEEDPFFIRGAGVNRGRISDLIGYGGADAAAEEVMTARDCILALHTGASVCIQHVSSGRSVELIRTAKRMGADIHAEATPHHFTLTEEAVLVYGTNARMNPPLRTQADRDAVIEGLKDGTIDIIATDHAPHSAEEKALPLEKAPSGIIGLETALGLGILSLVEPGHLTLMELIRKMSTNPADLYRMIPGSVAPGEIADLVLFSPGEQWKADRFVSKSSNSPFLGWTLPGKIHYTVCGGDIVYVNSPDLKNSRT